MVPSIGMRAGALNRPRGASFVLALVTASACSTVEPGNDPQIAMVVYDDDFFYCQVQPNVLTAQSCANGVMGMDMGGCHSAAVSAFSLLPLGANDMVACDANGKHSGVIPGAAYSNYTAAQSEMTPNAETAPLLTHPTQKTAHPRQIFDGSSNEAEIIRQWAQRSSR